MKSDPIIVRSRAYSVMKRLSLGVLFTGTIGLFEAIWFSKFGNPWKLYLELFVILTDGLTMQEILLSVEDVICNPSVLSTPNISEDVLSTSSFFIIGRNDLCYKPILIT